VEILPVVGTTGCDNLLLRRAAVNLTLFYALVDSHDIPQVLYGMENWKELPGYEGRYEVSDEGRVRSLKTGLLKKPTLNEKDGRLFILLWKNSRKPKLRRIHRLILETFRGPCPIGKEGCHNDGNKRNNRLTNLRWDTPKNNHADKIKHGTTNRGERCGIAKLTLKQVKKIRKDKRLQRIIAAEYGVLQNTISRIKNGKRWAYD